MNREDHNTFMSNDWELAFPYNPVLSGRKYNEKIMKPIFRQFKQNLTITPLNSSQNNFR